MPLESVEMTQVCILNYYVLGPHHLGFGSLEEARKSMGETVWSLEEVVVVRR